MLRLACPFQLARRWTTSPSEAGLRAAAVRQQRREEPPSMATKLAHAGIEDGRRLSTTFERPPDGNYADGPIYSRSCNPTRKLLERALGKLELEEEEETPTYCFSSGMAAVASLVLACSDVHMLMPLDVYHGLPTQLHSCLATHGVRHTAVDMTSLTAESLRQHCNHQGTLIVWLESPSNPMCQVTDIKGICKLVDETRATGAFPRTLTVVDSTWAPPCITRPLTLGADAVVHSATKFLGGHSDVLLGSVSCSPRTENGVWLKERLEQVQTSIGAVASPLECWLTLRGLRTLHLRAERQCQTAMKLSQFLDDHDEVAICHYPGRPSHPQHEIAKRQMIGPDGGNLYGGMLSFEVRSEAFAMAVAGGCRIIKRATSLGGTETLIEHRASIEPPERRVSPPGLLRVSVGLEEAADVINDLRTALDVAATVMKS
ncbi:hypothetical protein THAOC_03197 [Thalassiosira oceanica]|uniref:cystathionine gamma-lyase n=1 Tax=Thalassiosira oceanica TaxID=159749 RepID=K0TCA0_THAOC|nr:hypothetical protein THAOC_03197 [Thalassiosira oceanica]|eukprot:EJK75090.1 hypothetical protein THAOC_03197 [Thalassiosira oceanica]